MRRLKFVTHCFFLFVLGGSALEAADNSEAELAWDQASRYLFQEAHERFQTLAETSPTSPKEIRLGRALTLLNVQPKTRGNIQTAADLLSELVSENSGDGIGIAAKYYLGRIEQAHRFEPNYKLASEHYRQLFESYPQHRLAQTAFVKWGMLQIYTPLTEEELRGKIQSLEAMANVLSDKIAIREFHMLIADAYGRLLENGEASLNHLIAAEAIGFSSRRIEATTLVRIGETALQLGNPGLALPYYKKFVQQFPRDNRNYTIRQRIRDIEQESAE